MEMGVGSTFSFEVEETGHLSTLMVSSQEKHFIFKTNLKNK